MQPDLPANVKTSRVLGLAHVAIFIRLMVLYGVATPPAPISFPVSPAIYRSFFETRKRAIFHARGAFRIFVELDRAHRFYPRRQRLCQYSAAN